MVNNLETYIINRLEKIKKNFENIDASREDVIKLNRELINITNKVLSTIYSGDEKAIGKYINKMIRIYREIEKKYLSSETPIHEYTYYIRILKDGIKEYVEAILFYNFYRDGDIEEMVRLLERVPDDIFVEGLMDFVGELRRTFLETLKNKELDKAEKTLNLMNTIYKSLITTTLKSFFVKDFKHKLDIFRGMILRSMEDYIIALYSSKGG